MQVIPSLLDALGGNAHVTCGTADLTLDGSHSNLHRSLVMESVVHVQGIPNVPDVLDRNERGDWRQRGSLSYWSLIIVSHASAGHPQCS